MSLRGKRHLGGSLPDTETLANMLAGQYAVDHEVGRGGMGIVYVATDVRLDRRVAIKVLPPSLAHDAGLRERFLREARTAAQLSHPNIVPVYRADEIGRFAFFVMGFVDGESLAERIRRLGVLSPGETVRVLREAAWALAYAHARGVVHRDVKPENLMLEKAGGRVVVTDFGIARDTNADRLTRDGTVLGSVHYMSPEQIAGDELDGRSDLYALGVIGFQCLTGRVPFDAEAASAVIVQHATLEPPDVRALAPETPPALAAVVERCLAKNPEDRYPSGEALAEALTAALETAADTGSHAAPPRQVSETEARAIWQRAAELQAEAATRAQTRYKAGDTAAPATPAGGYRLRDVEQAAAEAGIGAEFVAIALAERRDQASVVAAGASDRQERVWSLMLTDQRSLTVSATLSGSPRDILEAIGRVFPEAPFRLTLRDTIGGHPLDGGIMVFDISRQIMNPDGMTVAMFAYRMAQIELRQLHVAVRPLPSGGCEVRCYGDLRPGLRKNWRLDRWIAGVGGVLGAGGASAVALGPLGLGAVAAAAPVVAGGAVLTGGLFAWYRWLYRRALSKAGAELEELLARIGAELRARAVFGAGPVRSSAARIGPKRPSQDGPPGSSPPPPAP